MEYALKENELIPLTFDIMFTEIFNNPDNICILEEFISNYLDIPLKEVTGNLKILSRRLKKEVRYDSRKEVDLLLNYKGKKINIEMSNNKSDGVINRNVVYLCKIHGNQLKVILPFKLSLITLILVMNLKLHGIYVMTKDKY